LSRFSIFFEFDMGATHLDQENGTAGEIFDKVNRKKQGDNRQMRLV